MAMIFPSFQLHLLPPQLSPPPGPLPRQAEELMAVKHLPRAKTLGLAVALLTRPDEAPKR